MTQPQQCQIQAASATYTTVYSNTRSPTHWARPGIEPASSWMFVRFISTGPWWELPGHTFNHDAAQPSRVGFHYSVTWYITESITIHGAEYHKGGLNFSNRWNWTVLSKQGKTGVYHKQMEEEEKEGSPGQARTEYNWEGKEVSRDHSSPFLQALNLN